VVSERYFVGGLCGWVLLEKLACAWLIIFASVFGMLVFDVG